MQTGRGAGLGWLYWSRALAICAILATIGLELLGQLVSWAVCVDACPSSEMFTYNLRQGGIWTAIICVFVAALAYVLFLVYALRTGQGTRARNVALFFVIGGLIGFGILFVILNQIEARVPVTGELSEHPAAQLGALWSGALFLTLLIWSSVLLALQWSKPTGGASVEQASSAPSAA